MAPPMETVRATVGDGDVAVACVMDVIPAAWAAKRQRERAGEQEMAQGCDKLS